MCLLYWLNLPSVTKQHSPHHHHHHHSLPMLLSVSLTHNHTCLCQGWLGGLVKLSIAHKRSFIKADRRGSRLLKLITPWSHREYRLLSVSNGPSPSSPPYLHLHREQNRVDVWRQGQWLRCETGMDNLKTKDLQLVNWLFYYICKKRWHQLHPSFQEAI